jgi:hypothetical protein
MYVIFNSIHKNTQDVQDKKAERIKGPASIALNSFLVLFKAI